MPDQQPEQSRLHVKQRLQTTSEANLPPGWVRATAILLRGMERLRAAESCRESGNPQ